MLEQLFVKTSNDEFCNTLTNLETINDKIINYFSFVYALGHPLFV